MKNSKQHTKTFGSVYFIHIFSSPVSIPVSTHWHQKRQPRSIPVLGYPNPWWAVFQLQPCPRPLPLPSHAYSICLDRFMHERTPDPHQSPPLGSRQFLSDSSHFFMVISWEQPSRCWNIHTPRAAALCREIQCPVMSHSLSLQANRAEPCMNTAVAKRLCRRPGTETGTERQQKLAKHQTDGLKFIADKKNIVYGYVRLYNIERQQHNRVR